MWVASVMNLIRNIIQMLSGSSILPEEDMALFRTSNVKTGRYCYALTLPLFVLSLIITLLPPLQANAQLISPDNGEKPVLHFESIDHGETSKQITDIFHDSSGFLWVGTANGLNRFNGVTFDMYTRTEDPASLGDNFISSIYEDRNQQLWIGGRSIISRYNRNTDRFVRYHLPEIPDTLAVTIDLVESIREDRDGTLWVTGGSNGLYYYDEASDAFKIYAPLSTHLINAVLPATDGGLWIATADDGLQLIDTDTGEIRKFSHHDEVNYNKTNLVRDREGEIWLTTQNDGVSKVLKSADGHIEFRTYRNETGQPKVLGNNLSQAIHVDRQGHIWVGNDNGGLHLYDREHDRFHHYGSDPYDTRSLSHHSVTAIHQDRDGRLWVGTAFSGLNVMDPYAHKFEYHHTASRFSNNLTNNIIRGFQEDDQGNIWIATDGGGLNYFNRDTGHFTSFRHDPEDPYSLGSDAVLLVEYCPDGDLWVSSYDGGLQMLVDAEEGRFVSIEEIFNLQGYTPRSPFDIHFDREHPWVWIAEFDEGVVRINTETGDFTRFWTTTGDQRGQSMQYTIQIYEDSRNNLWLSSALGLSLLDSENKMAGPFQRFSPDQNDPESLTVIGIRQVIEDQQERIWVATEKGLSRYIPETGGFQHYFESDGLPTDNLQSIIEDDNGDLWIGTMRGLSHFNPDTETFINYRRSDGLQGYEFSRFSNHKLSTGELLFGGLDGFNLFDPNDIQSNPNIPPVHITGLSLFNEPVLPGDPDSPLDQHIMVTDTLTLTYRQNILTFEFIALNYTMAEQNQYAFMMEGFETDWNYAGDQRTATYMNLDPGTYRFRVKASNNDGLWNETGASVVLTIVPPFWQTTWFYAGTALFFAIIIFIGFRVKMAGIRRHNLQLEKQVKKRTTELREANDRLNKHIEEKEKIYSVLAHDLRSPFMSLIGLSEYLRDNLEEDSNEENREIAGNIMNASQKTYHLLENLLQWSEASKGKKEVIKDTVNLKELIDESVATAKLQAEMKEMTIVNKLKEPVYAYADRNMVQTVLRNLITNAIKFSHKKGTVSVTAKANEKYVETTVTDQGVGMDEKDSKQLFSTSSTVNQKGTMGEKGSGFGLMVCKEFIERNGGTISVSSKPGEGSSFVFKLEKSENHTGTGETAQ